MRFKSLNKNSPHVSFREALFQPMAPDGGLYVPVEIPTLPEDFIANLANETLQSMGEMVLSLFVNEVPKEVLKKIIEKTFHFEIPLTKLDNHLFLLELFHGPTLAFKDVGARFMAEMMSYFLQIEKKHIQILVATSGDTGSAVANGFFNVPNVEVFVLYPGTKISYLQEQQIATLGHNIHPIEIKGTFDDCQALVKESLMDKELKSLFLTTANSINIGRLLPQIIYYFWGIGRLRALGEKRNPDMIVPSGNFGNITAAAYAKVMGAPINHLIAATNSNDIVPRYLATGEFKPAISKQTLSNAMDVGNPNNFVRLQSLYHNQYQVIKKSLTSVAISDEETLTEIKENYLHYKIILDPHTAVGVAAAKKIVTKDTPAIIAATAHPGKFREVIRKALEFDIPLPEALEKVKSLPKKSVTLNADYSTWKKWLLTSS